MGYVTREMIDRAKKMDLLTYLQTYEPQELVHFGGNTYTGTDKRQHSKTRKVVSRRHRAGVHHLPYQMAAKEENIT